MKKPKEIHEDVLLFIDHYEKQGWRTSDKSAISDIKKIDKESLIDLEWQETIIPQYTEGQQWSVSDGQYRFRTKKGYGIYFVKHISKPISVQRDFT